MRTVRLGRTGVEVSIIGLGTWAFGGPNTAEGRPVGWFGSEDRYAVRALREAAEVGINHWDTADVYGEGHAERIVGGVWKEVRRDSIFLASKVGWDPGPYGHYYHPEQIRSQLENSLRNLATDYIDLYYLHHCDFGPQGEYLDDALEELQRYRDEGKIRFLGLSDWKAEQIRHYADQINPDVVQCYRNVVDDDYEASGLASWVSEAQAGVAFFSPLKHGLLLANFEGPVTFGAGDHRNLIHDFRDYGLLARLQTCRRELEKRFSEHPQPVLHGLLGSLLSDTAHGCVLVGLHRPEHIRAVVSVTEPLDAEAAEWVRRLYQLSGRPTRAAWRANQARS